MTEQDVVERIEHALRASDLGYDANIVALYARAAWSEVKAIAREDTTGCLMDAKWLRVDGLNDKQIKLLQDFDSA